MVCRNTRGSARTQHACLLFTLLRVAPGPGKTLLRVRVCVCVVFVNAIRRPHHHSGKWGGGWGVEERYVIPHGGGRGAKKGFCGQKYWDKALQPERWTLMNFRPPCLFCELFWRHGFYFVRRCNFHRQPIAGTSTHPHPL